MKGMEMEEKEEIRLKYLREWESRSGDNDLIVDVERDHLALIGDSPVVEFHKAPLRNSALN